MDSGSLRKQIAAVLVRLLPVGAFDLDPVAPSCAIRRILLLGDNTLKASPAAFAEELVGIAERLGVAERAVVVTLEQMPNSSYAP